MQRELLLLGCWLALSAAAAACGGGDSSSDVTPDTPLDGADGETTGADADGDLDAPVPDADAGPDAPVPDADGDLDAPLPDVEADGEVVADCPAPLIRCDDVCVDPSSNPMHCGECDNTCGAGETCVAGTCDGTASCPPGYVDCGGECRDLSADPEQCGSCDTRCGDLEICADGLCVCRPGFQRCGAGGACTDVSADSAHCGACGTRCDGVCVGGTCRTAADCTLEVCAGACVDTASDPRHCGSCGDACDRDQLCIDGGCADYEPAVGCSACDDSCRACPRDERCCATSDYGVICVDGADVCP